MRFRVYKIDLLPPFPSVTDIHDPSHHHDTGMEFVVNPNAEDIACKMMKELYGFEGKYMAGWCVQWASRKQYVAGHINTTWYLRRVT